MGDFKTNMNQYFEVSLPTNISLCFALLQYNSFASYFQEMLFLSGKLMAAVFASLGVEPERFAKDFSGCRDTSGMRMNYYPKCPIPDAHLGVGPHSDPCALTILWQDQEVSSLQVEKDNVWYDVYPVPSKLIYK